MKYWIPRRSPKTEPGQNPIVPEELAPVEDDPPEEAVPKLEDMELDELFQEKAEEDVSELEEAVRYFVTSSPARHFARTKMSE